MRMSDLRKPVALQIWTVREEAQRDYVGTLKKIAELGFQGVEQVHFLGYGGLSATQVRTLMSELGLQTAGVHVSLEEWEADAASVIAYVKELGSPYAAISWLPEERRTDEAAYRQAAESIKNIAAQCEQSGIKLLYHHHNFEFVQFAGQYALDLLGEIVGPEHLGVEVDVHWTTQAGVDPIAYLQKVGSRCPLIHFKDLNPVALHSADNMDENAFTPVGTGSLDFPALAAAAQYAEWYIVEQDFCQGDPFDTAKISLENLKQLNLVKAND